MSLVRAPLATIALIALAGTQAPAGATETVLAPVAITDFKAVTGRVESRFVVPARSRIGGTLVTLDVSEGSAVAAGQPIARVVDDKLALQLEAAEARIRAVRSELANARTELERYTALLARGAGTQQRADQARTQVEVLGNQLAAAEAERAVVVQQSAEGVVVAPAAGRVLSVPSRRGAVVLPGEPIATIAGGGVFLRLAIPERHAADMRPGAGVVVGEDGARPGAIEKVYPLIEGGRVTVDVAVDGLSDRFVGERVLVRVPVGERSALLVPEAAVRTVSGIDRVRIATATGARDVVVVVGPLIATAAGRHREILTGLVAGDRVILP